MQSLFAIGPPIELVISWLSYEVASAAGNGSDPRSRPPRSRAVVLVRGRAPDRATAARSVQAARAEVHRPGDAASRGRAGQLLLGLAGRDAHRERGALSPQGDDGGASDAAPRHMGRSEEH